MDTSFWPLFDLEVRTPSLVLRVPRDEDFPGLIAAIDAGIHDPGETPFAVAWTDAEPVARARNAVQHWWGARSRWSVDDWDLLLAIVVDGIPVGMQSVKAKDFPLLRVVHTGSWLTRSAQGQGYGKEMRSAVLHLVFEELGAQVAESGAYTDNVASARVSTAMGYRVNGTDWYAPRGVPKEVVRYALTAEDWRAGAASRPPVTVTGLDLSMFGLGRDEPDDLRPMGAPPA